MGAGKSINKPIDEDKLSRLPADVLYQLALALAGNPINIEDKIENSKQIINACRLNKRFNNLYCQNDRIWRELWLKDISTILPKENIKNKYLEALNYLNPSSNIGEGMVAYIKNHHKNNPLFPIIIAVYLNYDIIFYNWLELSREEERDEIVITAANNGRLQMIKDMAAKGVSNKALLEALDKAIYNGNVNTMKYIVEDLGIKPQYRHIKTAVETRDNEIVKYLQTQMWL